MRGHGDLSASKGQYETAAGHSLKMSGLNDGQFVQAVTAANNVFSAPRGKAPDVQRPVLNELHDRLTLALDRLSGGVYRIDVFADRVLGATPSEPTCASGGASTTCAAESLHVVVAGIERMASRLHDAADRVERIG